MNPIAGNQRFVCADTEVFHVGCLSLIPTSVANQLRKHVASLQHHNAQLVQQVRSASRIDELERALSAAHASCQRWEQIAADRLAQIGRLEARAQTDHFERMYEAARRERDTFRERAVQLERDRDNAKRELALHQAISGTGSAPVKDQTAQVKQEDTRSDTEIRAGLLELD